MTTTDDIDDTTLAAFVDGELDPAGCERVLRAMEADPQVRARVDSLRRAGDLMRLGFDHARPPGHDAGPRHGPRMWAFSSGRAASLVLVVSTLIAAMAGFYAGREAGVQTYTHSVANEVTAPHRVVLHVDKSGPRQFAAAIEYTRRFVASQSADSRIAVVAHADGLDLVRKDVSRFQDAIRSLIGNHDNVYFIACANSIRMLRDSGVEPTFIEKVDTSKPAFEQIVSRLDAGWTYVKIDELMRI